MNYLRKVLEELQKIKFPQRKEVTIVTIVVIISVLLFSLLLYFTDLISWLLIDKVVIGF